MKTVTLLASCMFALGCAGTARATDANLHRRAPATDASAADSGLLEALGAALAGATDTTTPPPTSSAGSHADSDASAHNALPDTGSDTTTATSDGGHAGSGGAPATPKQSPPILGWQSLLPGSIQ